MSDVKRKPLSAALGFLVFALIFALTVAIFSVVTTHFFGRDTAAGTTELPTVIIDAGHGGRDGGTVGSVGSVVEKELNLDISLKLRDMLTKSGYKVIMTRTEDIMLEDPLITSSKKASDLSARRKILEGVENAVFISIHMNAFSDSRYSGLQVYYSQNDPRSQNLALTVQNSVASTIQPQNDRKIKNAGENIFLLHRAACPAVLIECGFLSNPEECARLAEDAYRTELSRVICDAICEYISQNH